MKAILLSLLLAATANAQTYVQTTYSKVKIKSGVITSGTTTLSRVDLDDNAVGVNIVVSATSTVSVDVILTTKDGVTLVSRTLPGVSPTNVVSLTLVSPFYFQQMKLSPTTPLTGLTQVHGTIVQSR